MTYKQSEILHIKIKELFNIEKGTLQSSKCIEGQYDFITASSEWKTHNEFTHDTEAIIIAVAASGSLGRAHYVNGKFISSDLCFILTPKSEKYPLDLSFYYFIFNSIRDDLVKSTATGTSKLAINKSNFDAYQIPYLDVSKQKEFKNKLVNITERKGQLVAINEKQTEIIQSLRQQILQDAITGKLSEKWRKENPNIESAEVLLEKIKAEKERLINKGKISKQKVLSKVLEDEIQFKLPDNWMVCRFGDYALLERGKFSIRPRNDPTCFGGEYPFIQIGSLDASGKIVINYEQTLNEKGLACSKMFEKGTLMIAIVGGTIGNLGTLGKDMCFPDSIVGIRPRQESNQDYILFLLRYYQPIIRKLAYQMAGQPNIKLPTLNNLVCYLPPLAEQEFIVNRVEFLFKKLDRIEELKTQSAETLDLISKTILKDMFAE